MLGESMITERLSRDIIEEYRTYFDKFGMVQPTIGGNSFNGVRYTGEYVIALHKEGKLDEKGERNRLFLLFKSLQREPGLLMRTPENEGGYQSIDDTIAALTADYYIYGGFAEKFLEYGRLYPAVIMDESDPNKEKVQQGWGIYNILRTIYGQPKYVYNNINPEEFALSSWLGRFPQLIAHAQFIAGEKVPLWRKLWWAGAVIQSSFSKEQDNKVLGWYLVLVGKDQSGICKAASSFWSYMMKKHYPEGIGQVLGDYFGNHNHPSAYWLRHEFGD
jgi:hypothetical protein